MSPTRPPRKAPVATGAKPDYVPSGEFVKQAGESDEHFAARMVALHYREVIESKREAGQSGDGDALLSAVMNALIARERFPEWLALELAGAIYRYTQHDARTLDEAFRVKRPDGYRLAAARDRRRKGLVVTAQIMELHSAGAAVDEALFAAVGELHGVKKTTISDWYYLHRTHPMFAHKRPVARSALKPELTGLADKVNWKR